MYSLISVAVAGHGDIQGLNLFIYQFRMTAISHSLTIIKWVGLTSLDNMEFLGLFSPKKNKIIKMMSFPSFPSLHVYTCIRRAVVASISDLASYFLISFGCSHDFRPSSDFPKAL